MSISSYQVELLVKRFRGWLSGDPVPDSAQAGDPVEITGQAAGLASPAGSLAERVRTLPPPADPAHVADFAEYPPAVAEEIERRAGSFMNPAYPEEPPPGRIPRLRREH